MAKFAAVDEKLPLATNVIISAIISNMIVKLGIAFFKGSGLAGKLVMLAFGSVIAVAIIYILFSSWIN